MKNFDITQLTLINPCSLTDECYIRAVHAQDILKQAQIVDTFEKATQNLDYLVATSSIDTKSEKRHLRKPVPLEEFTQKITDIEGQIGLCFGREDYGLYNEEIAKCDIMVKIPTSASYPSLNLSHAVCVILYALYASSHDEESQRRIIGDVEREKLYDFFSCLLSTIGYPKHKKENTEIMFRRIMGRAVLSTWEYHTLMGVLSDTLKKCPKKEKLNQ